MVNLFIFDLDPAKCVAAYCDDHINKMLLELCQMLTSVWCIYLGEDRQGEVGWRQQLQLPIIVGKNGDQHRGYFSTKGQRNHPLIKWMAWSTQNYALAITFGYAMANEQLIRDPSSVHASRDQLKALARYTPTGMQERGLTPMPQAMPARYKVNEHTGTFHDIVTAYRQYMVATKLIFGDKPMKNGKWNYATWFSCRWVDEQGRRHPGTYNGLGKPEIIPDWIYNPYQFYLEGIRNGSIIKPPKEKVNEPAGDYRPRGYLNNIQDTVLHPF